MNEGERVCKTCEWWDKDDRCDTKATDSCGEWKAKIKKETANEKSE